MISVGIDVSKGKSTICILKPYGEILMSPQDYTHTQSDMKKLVDKLSKYEEELHITMEATGVYHLPVSQYLKSHGYTTYIINPLEMKRYRCQGIRNPKTDKIDALMIAQYGIDFWYRPCHESSIEDIRTELKLLGTQYCSFSKTRQDRCLALCNLLDRTNPGIYNLLDGFNRYSGKDKLCDFVHDFYHRDCIVKYSKNKFIERYQSWTKRKGYRFSDTEAGQLYQIAKESIPTLESTASTKLVVQEIANVLKEVNASLYDILSRMNELAKMLPEYDTVMTMKGVGASIGPRLIAEIGDPRRFHSAKALIAYAGIDAPPFQSGKFTGTERHMSKRGSRIMRKLGYEVMDSINKHQSLYADDPVCIYFLRKRAEGKHYGTAMFAAYNKFLRIYHSRVSSILNETETAV
ncbi:IS110 family transposase [Eisenbergiella tayi]|uniref:IS110 family transposase n=1 Tax=Eisenbergiella porci TaxID=2652274 RepID=A0A6N7WRT0_9FIRM|nr:IS110 family transposase [Eisenbergiella porci]MSS92120.1 IS110 family transposase [Eisenbergiella porci]